MGWALWVKLLPPLRICWNETALMLKALWVHQHCTDKPKKQKDSLAEILNFDATPLVIFGLLWILDAKDFVWELDEKFLLHFSTPLPPPLPSCFPFFKSFLHSIFQTRQIVALKLNNDLQLYDQTCTWPHMVMAGYSNPAMSFPVVSKDVITGWFSQLLQHFFNVQALNISLTIWLQEKKQTIEKLCLTYRKGVLSSLPGKYRQH